MSATKLRIGFIPLVDAAAVLIAADCGFATGQGLQIELVREVSWSNVRDKLNIGLFDAAHMLSPMAIASGLGIGHVRVPLVAPFNLGMNGNAITISPQLGAALAAVADGDLANPRISSRALARVVADRKKRGVEPLVFGMTFPFSNHNYELRFWMAAGGVDPDEDVRLVVLPPPYMVESLSNGHVDGFCVGAPWNSVAARSGVGQILHFGSEIVGRMSEKVLAMRANWAAEHAGTVAALVRALDAACSFIDDPANRRAVAEAIARRIEVEPDIVADTLAGRLRLSAGGPVREDARYIVIGGSRAARPDPVQAAWLYSQIARWGQAPLSPELQDKAVAVFRSDLYDGASVKPSSPGVPVPEDGVGAFAGPSFHADDVAGYLSNWAANREP